MLLLLAISVMRDGDGEHVGMWDRGICIAVTGVYGKGTELWFHGRKMSTALQMWGLWGAVVGSDSSTMRALPSSDRFPCTWGNFCATRPL